MPRTLVVTDPWLPSYSAGVKHVAILCRYLPAAGWEPLLLSRDGDGQTAEDEAQGVNAQHLDATPSLRHAALLPVVRVPGALRRNRWLRWHARLAADRESRGSLSAHAIAWQLLDAAYPLYGHYPDRNRGWVEPAVEAGLVAVRQYGVGAILSLCPTSTAHIVGGEIARRAGVPWVAVFIGLADFYVGLGDGRSRRARAVQRVLARRWLKGASRAACVTVRMQEYVRDTYGVSGDVVVLPFDPDERKVAPHRLAGAPMRLLHTGAIHADDDRIAMLFDALDTLVAAIPAAQQTVVVELVGSGCDARLLALLRDRPCATVVRLMPLVAPAEAVRLQRESDVLLLFAPSPTVARATGGMHPGLGTLFEYLNAARPIVAIGTDAGDVVRRVLAETRTGVVTDDAAVLATLLSRYRAELVQAGAIAFAGDEGAIARYAAPEQAKRLGALLDGASAERFGSWQRARR